MAPTIFDRETLLDLVVNGVPLFILLFFSVAFLVVNPFGFDPLLTGVQHGLIVIPFVSLVLLTYLSAKAIAGDERTSEVYLPGQATVPGATPIEHGEEEASSTDDRAAIEGETDAPSAEADESTAEESTGDGSV